jgi:hypothetical protein
MFRFYLVPKIGGGPDHPNGEPDVPRAKYFGDMTGPEVHTMAFGLQPHVLVGADLSTFDHNTVVSNSDVIALPANLDQSVSAGALTTVQNALEAMNIPAGWVTTSMTYREVLRKVAKMMFFFQRLKGVGLARLLTGSVALNTQFQDLPLNARQRLIAAADSLNLDRSGMSGSTTIRQIMKAMADQLPHRMYCGIEI